LFSRKDLLKSLVPMAVPRISMLLLRMEEMGVVVDPATFSRREDEQEAMKDTVL
jgi:hypothetical protein